MHQSLYFRKQDLNNTLKSKTLNLLNWKKQTEKKGEKNDTKNSFV